MTGGEGPAEALDRELLRRLWRDPRGRSRNQNFARFRDDPAYRRVVRRIRFLRALGAEIRGLRGRFELRVDRGDGTGRSSLELVVPSLSLRRTVLLSEIDLELLREDAAVAELLGRHSDASFGSK